MPKDLRAGLRDFLREATREHKDQLKKASYTRNLEGYS
jgi:hypothetical protein